MSTKVKGLFRGFKYISSIFEEEKDAEIQIGFPTDVKHVAHIGWDGPSAQENPSWMKDFKVQSAPLGSTPGSGDPNTNTETPAIKWASEDKKSRKSKGAGTGGETPELPKSSRRQSSSSSASDNPESPKAAASKPRQRRHHSKDGSGSDVTKSPEDVPHLPKKTRRKKSKESDAIGAAPGRKASRAAPSHPTAAAATSAPDGESDNGDQCEEAPVKEEFAGK
ncbi:PREDICTED: CRIB domain-containing protein RIC10-like [Ipomoea nil]|uniref:CRIB domain-containing protein RIC10-like n=1 Tax=Ipomoea nil TaxID=35883 RepID=UPI0009013A01|nr:PREDICTED: CRIB domain-containing protein RIC10-like [Ipomoea nil]